jgi:2-aminophenol/2-amino-5-chlorophenol 1,6-dioxygenase alpha subunit
MSIIAAFLMPGLPHPLLKPKVAPWKRLGDAARAASAALADAKPDALVVYSTQWIAVLDQLWQTRPEIEGIHVDENWYEWGDIPVHIKTDVTLSRACIDGTAAIGIRSKAVDYDAFPIDTGTLVAQHFLNPDAVTPVVTTSNNVYHDWDKTEGLGRVVAAAAEATGKRVAVIGVGGLSARMFRTPIDPETDHFADPDDDGANCDLLKRLESGDADAVRAAAAKMAADRPTDFGMKQIAFVLGAVTGRAQGAVLHGYEPVYGTGAAVVELRL